MKIFYFVVLAVMIAILVILGIYLLIGYLSYRFCLTRKGGMIKRIQKKYKAHLEMIGINKENFKDYKKLEIQSEEGLKLRGFYKDNEAEKIAILLHGYGRDHLEVGNIAKIFENRGYDILAIDMRSHGQSEGESITMGREESKDLLLWVDKMLEFKKHYKIILFGMSMGASTVCLSIGDKIPNNVILAIEDCGYDNAEKQLSYVYSRKKSHIKIVYKIFVSFVKKCIGLDLKSIDVCKNLKNSKIPVMFIHGEKDDFVPIEMVYNLYAQVPENRKKVYIALEATHTLSSFVDFKKYENQINHFLNQYNM